MTDPQAALQAAFCLLCQVDPAAWMAGSVGRSIRHMRGTAPNKWGHGASSIARALGPTLAASRPDWAGPSRRKWSGSSNGTGKRDGRNRAAAYMSLLSESLNTLRELLDDYDGLNARITQLSERVDNKSVLARISPNT